MRVVIAPDKFKGFASARAMADRLAAALERSTPRSDVIVLPMADGGQGSLDALAPVATAIDTYTVEDAWGDATDAQVLWNEGDAWVELAQTAGVGSWRGPDAALAASTRGAGLLIERVRDAERVFVAVGGTLSSDGGVGLASALGWRFVDAAGDDVPPGGRGLRLIDRVMAPAGEPRRCVGACDIVAPLLGERGAARRYSPQKGADPEGVALLERGLEHLADLAERDLGRDVRDVPGAAAGGGTGFGLAAFLDAPLERGFELIAARVGLEQAIATADLVVTGEGAFDDQSLDGKVPIGVLDLANRHQVPCALVAGRIDAQPGEAGFVAFADLGHGEVAAVEEILRSL